MVECRQMENYKTFMSDQATIAFGLSKWCEEFLLHNSRFRSPRHSVTFIISRSEIYDNTSHKL